MKTYFAFRTDKNPIETKDILDMLDYTLHEMNISKGISNGYHNYIVNDSKKYRCGYKVFDSIDEFLTNFFKLNPVDLEKKRGWAVKFKPEEQAYLNKILEAMGYLNSVCDDTNIYCDCYPADIEAYFCNSEQCLGKVGRTSFDYPKDLLRWLLQADTPKPLEKLPQNILDFIHKTGFTIGCGDANFKGYLNKLGQLGFNIDEQVLKLNSTASYTRIGLNYYGVISLLDNINFFANNKFDSFEEFMEWVDQLPLKSTPSEITITPSQQEIIPPKKREALPSNWSIECNDEHFVLYKRMLKGLGYKIYINADQEKSMGINNILYMNTDNLIFRGLDVKEANNFKNYEEFLGWFNNKTLNLSNPTHEIFLATKSILIETPKKSWLTKLCQFVVNTLPKKVGF